MERKRLQIEHAAHCSQAAKLVKLADKLYNLRDLNRCTPQGSSCTIYSWCVWVHVYSFFFFIEQKVKTLGSSQFLTSCSSKIWVDCNILTDIM